MRLLYMRVEIVPRGLRMGRCSLCSDLSNEQRRMKQKRKGRVFMKRRKRKEGVKTGGGF